MNKFKFIFEKSYTDRCVSKKITKEIILESALDHQNQKDELNNLAFAALASNYPEFINNINERNATGWTQPQIKDFQLINNYDL
ncbi:MAG: hypothetical protein A2068_12240 [Ignavibacteria bacterium GWB2_35_6b]|nr:MAG: hypothetical protein A2068_12240 [Ignavibacteria bacterium GWB2_35_6b]